MNREDKAAMIGELNGVFDNAAAVVVTHYKGLSVAEMTDLRSQIREAGDDRIAFERGREPAVLATLLGAEIGCLEELLQQDYLCPGIGRLMYQLRCPLYIRINIPTTSHLSGRNTYLHILPP